jgi:curved DNA-binding protein CbpA
MTGNPFRPSHRRRARGAAATTGDPFGVLGLTPDPGLTDDDIRVAWRRIAAATHPDRADGGNLAAFAEAARAYHDLRTPVGRGEALADLREQRDRQPRSPKAGGPTPAVRPPARAHHLRRWAGASGALRLSRPADAAWLVRPVRLAVRILVTAAFCAAVIAVAGWRPATPALIVGALTWLLRSARHDIGRSRRPSADRPLS